jgi:hypothetical protein
VIIDIFSRYVVGWTVETSEDSTVAKTLIADAIARQGVGRDQLTLHADLGTSMTSKTVAQLLEDLGVTRTHSRPHVSDDNPYIEAHFKTLKYCPAWPGHFDTVDDARAWCEQFFDYYNHIHRHRALGLHTRPLRHSHRDPGPAGKDAPCLLRRQPFQVRRTTHTAGAADRGVDQRTPGGADTERLNTTCLNGLDSFRPNRQPTGSRPSPQRDVQRSHRHRSEGPSVSTTACGPSGSKLPSTVG